MATHSSILALRIPGMEEPGGLLSMGSHRVGHGWSDLAAAAAADINPDEGDGTPLQNSCLENPMDGGAWHTAVHEVTKNQTLLSDFTFTHWRRKWQPTLVFLLGASQGQRSLVGCHPWCCTESDTTDLAAAAAAVAIEHAYILSWIINSVQNMPNWTEFDIFVP